MNKLEVGPKAAARILTLEGFLRWTEGLSLRAKDFKNKEENHD